MMKSLRQLFLFLATIISIGFSQEYQDYDYQDYADGYGQQDNLYADYAMKQQDKAVG